MNGEETYAVFTGDKLNEKKLSLQYSVTVDPSGKFLYAANGYSNTVSGTLSFTGNFSPGTTPMSVVTVKR